MSSKPVHFHVPFAVYRYDVSSLTSEQPLSMYDQNHLCNRSSAYTRPAWSRLLVVLLWWLGLNSRLGILDARSAMTTVLIDFRTGMQAVDLRLTRVPRRSCHLGKLSLNGFELAA